MTADQERCEQVLTIVGLTGDKWTLPVLSALRQETRRFGELQRAIGGISQRMLTVTLRELERDGLVLRTVYPTVPPRVEYTLTELGSGLLRAAATFGRWAEDNLDHILSHRRAALATAPNR